MTPLEELRLAVAVAHTVPGARLVLHTRSDQTIEVGAHDGATIGVCAMRRVVLACACPNQPDFAARIERIVFDGVLGMARGGILRARVNGRARRVVPTFLGSAPVGEILDGIGEGLEILAGVPSDAIHAVLKPDHHLGVSVVMLSADDPVYDDRLDDLALEIAARCYVEELMTPERRGAVAERTSDSQERP